MWKKTENETPPENKDLRVKGDFKGVKKGLYDPTFVDNPLQVVGESELTFDTWKCIN